ncbi:S9 family peptidase, partial [Arsukibacterium sp.]|uniref:S9 family peptidase n=1 Tax=Arsukibacterium sp. TaxID=1977258 RepID=UPI00299D67CC
MKKLVVLPFSLMLLLLCSQLHAAAVDTGYREPAADVTAIVDAAPSPGASLSPDGSVLLSLQFPALPSLTDLAAPEHRLAGVRINPANNGPSQPRYIAGVKLIDIASGKSREIKGLPANLKVIAAEWSPDSRYIALVQLAENASSLWRIDTKNATAKRWGKVQPNAVQGARLEWAANSNAVYLLAVSENRPATPVAPTVPAGPVVTEARGRTAPARTYQDLLEDAHDEALFSHYFSSQLVKISLKNKVTTIGQPALLRSFSLSPDNQHILISRVVPPFSYAVPIYRFATTTEVWNLAGEVSYTVAQQPVADNLPIAFDAVVTGPRSVSWRNDAPATLYWATAADGGDPANEAEVRDQLWQLAAPFTAEPMKLLDMAFRFRDLLAANAGTALVYEGWWQDRQEKVWLISPDGSAKPRLLWQRSTEDRYADPGRPLMTTADNGQRLLRLEQGHIYLTAVGASEQGNRPFIDKYDLASGDTERLWRSEAPYYEYPITLLPSGKLLTQREAPTEPADFYLRDLQSGELTALTDTPHPMPHTLGISRELINYQRADGVPMSANLILPAGYDAKRDGPLPTVIWAYPREFRNAAAAGQVSDSPYRFNRVSYWTPQFL